MAAFSFELRQLAIPNVPACRHYSRKLEALDTTVFHRIHTGSPDSDNGESVAALFAAEGHKWIGTNSMPYTFIIPRAQPAGRLVVVEQCVPLTRKTPHAMAWNRRAVGIGVIGDFRHKAPTPKQAAACHWLALRLHDIFTPHLRILREKQLRKDHMVTLHSNLTSATSDPRKLTGGQEECPGPLFAPTWRSIKVALRGAGSIM